MANWRLARCLINLRAEVDRLAPGRSKVSDGTIGDSRHSARASDHNPDSAGVVCAVDLTHDPAHGADMAVISEWLRTHRHPSLTYLIFDRRICSPVQGWVWRPYGGSNPHTKHLHVSASRDYDNPTPWGVARAVHVAETDDVTPADVPTPAPLNEEDAVPARIVMIPPGMPGHDGRHWITDGISAAPIATPDDEQWLVDWLGAERDPNGDPLFVRRSQLDAWRGDRP